MTPNKTRQLIYTALFAAIIFLGTSFFKIPVPPAIVHLGNALVVISFLALGTTYGMISACVGFFIFDLLNNYITSVHFTLLESIIVILTLHVFYTHVQHKDTLKNIATLGVLAGIVKIIVIFTRKLITNYLIVGNSTAFGLALSSMTNTFITSAVTAIFVPILYFALKKYLPILFTLQIHDKNKERD
ncbi:MULTISPECIES: ECF transporter S component [unclassified Granulicatella]|uniref:ECF transporter S component n=1 Tax=unclassified Granulicatella TaxID=2630493 RepID=UPI0010730120|nr:MULTISPECIES: ECF transporter S component [unclassified Granulicatella]MBF0779842.1 ECF transporter S component [Granulicatella sp. 19428wC4_WM01]TFU96142.1 hypothetical protein E4T68_01920 [Granulicatella sp. WM01]